MSKKILIVEDAIFMRRYLREIFVDSGYDVVSDVGTCSEGIESYKNLNPDLVMMDIIMPDISGLEAIKEIVSYDPDAKIIVCSALGQKEMKQNALDAGAKDFIEKPFKKETLLEMTKKVLGEE